jgi:ribonuclease III
LTSSPSKKASSDKAQAARLCWAHERLGYRFKNPELLKQALTHRSASQKNNERLEFLGDALLSFVVALRLFNAKASESEGDMSRMRAALVKGETLADLGRELELELHVIVGAGEQSSGGARRSSVLANTVEALIGGILLDGGFAEAEICINSLIGDRFQMLPDAASLKDAKTKLQEWLQARGIGLPEYNVKSMEGPPHKRTFLVQCTVGDDTVIGRGLSRRNAEQDAAKYMLSSLTSDN